MAMYSLEELKELIETVDKSSVTGLELVDAKGEKLVIKKKVYTAAQPVAVASPQITEALQASPSKEPEQEKPAPGKTITCPMVGVFYSASSPDAEPYVKVGSKVNKGDVVCIIEAMKLMNEITATESGTIEEILIENGQIAEFGQPLFRLS